MPQIMRHYCSRCQESVYNCIIGGKRVPLIFYMVVGQPEDTGPKVDMSEITVCSPLRALMALPVPRVEYCARCVAEVFGWPLLEAADDPAMAAFDAVPKLAATTAELDRTTRDAMLAAYVHAAVANSAALSVAAALQAAGVTDPAKLATAHAAGTVAVPVSVLPVAPPVPEIVPTAPHTVNNAKGTILAGG